MSALDQIDDSKLPKHIAIIMDGNGRWAKTQGKIRIFGHRNGVKAVREVTEACAEMGVSYLTLYAFSTENWARPQLEVNSLMNLLVDTIQDELPTLQKNNIRLQSIGDLEKLPVKTKNTLLEAIDQTKDNSQMTLVLALNYSGRWEISSAAQKLAEQTQRGEITPGEITEEVFATYLNTQNIPDPELLIRTSGEQRLSNFLLWQLAYAEFYFTPVLWPDFRKENLYEAIVDYQNRVRRFGKTDEQVL